MGAGPQAPASREPFDKRRASIEQDAGAQMLEDMARAIVFEPEGRGQEAADVFRAMAARAGTDRLFAQNEALMTRPDRSADLRRLSCRSLLVWGDADTFSPPEAGRAMAAAMPDAEFVLLEDCGHLPSLEAPMRVAAAIRARFV